MKRLIFILLFFVWVPISAFAISFEEAIEKALEKLPNKIDTKPFKAQNTPAI